MTSAWASDARGRPRFQPDVGSGQRRRQQASGSAPWGLGLFPESGVPSVSSAPRLSGGECSGGKPGISLLVRSIRRGLYEAPAVYQPCPLGCPSSQREASRWATHRSTWSRWVRRDRDCWLPHSSPVPGRCTLGAPKGPLTQQTKRRSEPGEAPSPRGRPGLS